MQVLTIAILSIAIVSAAQVQQNLKVDILPGGIFLNISSPIQNQIYSTRQIPVTVSFGMEAEFFMLLQDEKNFRTLCRECNLYNQVKPFSDGKNNVSIRVRNSVGTEAIETISFIVDTLNPIIKKTSPENGFTAGLFKVEFQEANPSSLYLNYGNKKTGFRKSTLNLSACVKEKDNYVCSTFINLNEFNGEDITYNYTLIDILNKSDVSRARTISIDTKPPVIEEINYIVKGRNTDFTIKINETNFDKLEYIDNSSIWPRWRIFCSVLKEISCSRTISTPKENGSILFKAADKAGNTDQEVFELSSQ